MGNNLNLCNGNNRDENQQVIVHERDAMVSPTKGYGKSPFAESEENSDVSTEF